MNSFKCIKAVSDIVFDMVSLLCQAFDIDRGFVSGEAHHRSVNKRGLFQIMAVNEGVRKRDVFDGRQASPET